MSIWTKSACTRYADEHTTTLCTVCRGACVRAADIFADVWEITMLALIQYCRPSKCPIQTSYDKLSSATTPRCRLDSWKNLFDFSSADNGSPMQLHPLRGSHRPAHVDLLCHVYAACFDVGAHSKGKCLSTYPSRPWTKLLCKCIYHMGLVGGL